MKAAVRLRWDELAGAGAGGCSDGDVVVVVIVVLVSSGKRERDGGDTRGASMWAPYNL